MALTYLLDTNTCVDYLRFGSQSLVTARIVGSTSVVLCSVVVAELLYGARRSHDVARNLVEVHAFCSRFASLPFDDPAASEYAKIRTHLAGAGRPIGPNDLLIASIALARGLTVVTHNVGEFSHIPGLNLEDWQVP